MRNLITLLFLVIGVFSFSSYAVNTDTTSNIIKAPMSDDGYKIGNAATDKIAFYDVATPVDQPDALTAALTSITHTAPSSDDFAIQNLTNSTPYGFASQDEGNTVLKVIASLQTRLGEVEARLEELGLINAN
jgi:hypothetical protein